MNVKTMMVAASVLVAAWTSASAQSQQDGAAVRDILNRAQTQQDRKAVEDLIGKLKTNPPAPGPQAAPQAPAQPQAVDAARGPTSAPASGDQPATASAPVAQPPVAAAPTATQQPTAATIDPQSQPAAGAIGGAPTGVSIGPGPTAPAGQAAEPQQAHPVASAPEAPTRVNAPGAPSHTDGRRPADGSDTARVGRPIGPPGAVPTPIAPSDAEMARAPEIAREKGLPTVDIEVLFAYDSSEIAPPAAESLMTLGRALADPQLVGQKFIIAGHTDAKGAAAYNLGLSDRRAQAVRAFLVEHFKIAPENLVARGYGESRLKNPRNPLGAENRRVQVINWSAQLVQQRRR